MKLSKFFAALFGLMGLAVALAAVWVGFHFRSASPMLLVPSEEARSTVQVTLEAVCAGDYRTASSQILGNPNFGMHYTPEDPVEAMVWEKFQESFTFQLVGDCTVTGSGMAQQVRISFLELDSVTENLKERTRALMEARITEAESVEEIYDENNEFSESFVMSALQDAAQDALEQDAKTVSTEVTVNMIWQNDSWWILPDSDLLYALSGGIVK